MLALTSVLLAASVDQTCPVPSGASNPPPCAVSNVPGCLPGYTPRFNSSGRLLFYACDVSYQSKPAEPPPPPAPPPQSQPSPAPAVVASPSPESRGQIGLVIMPGISAFPAHKGMDLDDTKAEAQVALEFRWAEGGARIRLTGEYTEFGKIGEFSFKYDFFDGFFFRPFLALGLGVASINPDAGVRASGSAAGGVDLYISRDFFLTGELKGRVFTEGTRGAAHGLVISDRRQISLLAGMGFYF